MLSTIPNSQSQWRFNLSFKKTDSVWRLTLRKSRSVSWENTQQYDILPSYIILWHGTNLCSAKTHYRDCLCAIDIFHWDAFYFSRPQGRGNGLRKQRAACLLMIFRTVFSLNRSVSITFSTTEYKHTDIKMRDDLLLSQCLQTCSWNHPQRWNSVFLVCDQWCFGSL